MFLIRTAFWLSIIVALIPVNPADLDEGQRPVSTMETLAAAQAFVRDVAGFCERNGEACATGREVFAQFGAKARTGLAYVASYLADDASPATETAAIADDPVHTGAID
ncbi:MAG: hypothetical protein BroJett030_32120 [Alphaproteobacteria bacterium]|nr:MAG: hypothetical protein BroJett030_32120 [Alphaproteobacteria bacterium]